MKLALKIIGGIVALVVIALLITPLFISADFLKAQLQTQVKAATGRDLTIKGKTSLTLLPNIAIVAEDVTLGNPAGFKSPYLVHFAKLETGAALMPLLSKSLEITGLNLDGASIHLEQLASGEKNWDFAKGKQAPALVADEKKKAAANPLEKLSVGDISLHHSDISYAIAGKPDMLVKNINLLLRGADGHGALKLSGSADYKERQVQLDLSVNEAKAFLAGTATATTAKVTLPGGALQFTGDASMKNGFSAVGDLESLISDLPGLLGWATGKPAGAGLPNNIRVQSKLTVDSPKSIVLDKLDASIDSLGATGKLAVDTKGAVPAIKGALQFASLDLNALGNKKAGGAGGTSTASGGESGWSTAPIDASGLRNVNADIALKIGKLVSGKLQVSDVAANLTITNGVLRLNLDSAGLYGGLAKGTVSADGSGAGVGIGADLTLNSVDIDALMTALSGASKLQGTANVALNIHGTGASQRAIVGNLGGTGNVRVSDGAVKGINIAQFLRDAKKGFLDSSGSKKTDFSELSASFTIAQGILTNKDLVMKAPIVSVTGAGTLNLPQKTVNYTVKPLVSTNVKGQGGDAASGLEIPLIVTGPWSSPEITPDLAAVIQNGLKNPEALKQNLKNIKEGIKNYNSPEDLKRALLGGGKAAEPTAAPAAASSGGEAAPATEPTAKQKKSDAILQGVGGLLQGLQKKE